MATTDSTMRRPAESAMHIRDPMRSQVRVLVVDDDHDAVTTMATLVQAYGYDVCTAENGRAALELVPSCRPQIVILDVNMPEMDGIELTRRLRKDPRAMQATIIAVTGNENHRQAASVAGVDHFFVKPVNFAQLEAVFPELAEPA